MDEPDRPAWSATVIGALTACVVFALLAPLGAVRARTPSRPMPPEVVTRSTQPTTRLRITPGRLAAAAALGVALVVAGPLLAVGSCVALAGWRPLRRLLEARSTRREVDAALPDAIELLLLVVHAGLTPHQAIVLLAERAPVAVRHGFAEVRRRAERGAALADALTALPECLGASMTVVADTIALTERHGTPIADALSQLAVDVRERRKRQAEVEARQLPIRMSFPLVICVLPSFVLVAIVPAVMAALTSLSDTGL